MHSTAESTALSTSTASCCTRIHIQSQSAVSPRYALLRFLRAFLRDFLRRLSIDRIMQCTIELAPNGLVWMQSRADLFVLHLVRRSVPRERRLHSELR